MPGMGKLLSVVVAVSAMMNASLALGQSAEEATIQSAAAVLREAMATPLNAIPSSMLENAHGVAIIPQVIKGSFVIGARRGRGVLCVRDPNGVWHAPVFITLTGGNVGWQVGLQSSDVVLVFRTQRSVEGLLSGKLTLGADVAVAAGPIGRQGSVGTDGRLQAEVFSYSRSRGLFAGVSVDGSVIRVDHLATGTFYQAQAPGQPAVIPHSALELTQTIAQLTRTTAPTNQLQQPSLQQQHSISESEMLRNQLSQTAPTLFEILDPQWQAFLALPEAIFNGTTPADMNTLRSVMQNYDSVANDPRFRDLAARPEFRSVHGILKHYEDALNPSIATLNLPPPPMANPKPVLPPQ